MKSVEDTHPSKTSVEDEIRTAVLEILQRHYTPQARSDKARKGFRANRNGRDGWRCNSPGIRGVSVPGRRKRMRPKMWRIGRNSGGSSKMWRRFFEGGAEGAGEPRDKISSAHSSKIPRTP